MKKIVSIGLFFLGLCFTITAQTFTTTFQSLSEQYPQIQLQSLDGKVNEISTINDGDFVIYMNGQVGDEKFRIENTSGFVGINNPVPSQQLDVTGSANVSSFLFSNHLRVAGNTDSNDWATGVNGSGIYREGKLWITSPSSPVNAQDQGLNLESSSGNVWTMLQNNSFLDIDLYYNNVLMGFFNENTGAYTVVSDKNRKKNIEPLPKMLEKVNELVATKYHYLETEDSENKSIGFMAQDAYALFPELVSVEDEHMGINYAGFSVVAIKAIQEQQAIIDEQEKELKNQKSLLEKHEQLIQQLLNDMEEIKTQIKD